MFVACRRFTAILLTVANPDLEHEFEERFGWLLRPHEDRVVRTLASFGTAPDTAMHALQKRLEARFDARRAKVGDAGIVADFMLGWVPGQVILDGLQEMPERLAADRNALDEDAVDRELAQLVERAESRVPGGAMLVLPPPCRQGQRVMHVAARLRALTSRRGEQRAREALCLFGSAFESLYAPWLLRLWILCDLADGAPKALPGMIGNVAGRISGRVSHELLLEDAVHLRNAAFHDRSEYDPDAETLALRDRGWSVSFGAHDIEVRVAATLEIQSCLEKVLAWSVLRAMYESGVTSATVEHLLAVQGSLECSPFGMNAAEKKMFEPARLFLASLPGGYEALLRLRASEHPFFR